MDREWLKARRALLKSVKEDVRRRLGDDPQELKSYELEAKRLARQRYRISSKSEILAEIEFADIVYGGDFHAHGPAQRTHYKILRHLAPDRPVVLAMECFEIRAQKFIDLFLKGKLTADELKKRVKWDERWGFAFKNYCALVELAKKRGWRVEAIGVPQGATIGRGGLERQDQAAAKRIKELMLRQPGALIYVIIGELHLTHLPERVAQEFRRAKRAREVAIHINAESVYFQLATKGLEHSVDVVRYSGDDMTRFSVLSSPPWVPWQSYLLHLDKAMELEFEDEDESDEEDFDPTDHVRRLAEWIAGDLGLKQVLAKNKMADLAVYGASDAKLWRKIESSLGGESRARERELARRLLLRGHSFMLPEAGVGCLAQMTVNHASHLASEYLQMRASGRKRQTWRFPRDFQAAILVEALAYFGSKQVNHKRQAETFSDLRGQLQIIPPTDEGRDALRLALDQRMSELVYFHQGRRRKRRVKPLRTVSYLEAALILGRMMGERLYGAYRARKISRRDVASLFKTDVLGREFSREYDAIVVKLARAVGTEISPAPSGVMTVKARRERL
ncbi:MAG: ChaN family lipoprotein [Bdellovibrionales bacterium]|jgi:hypothetical protein|nr:ChaN family lipoprotein [Bdellovibrionales bacterium]